MKYVVAVTIARCEDEEHADVRDRRYHNQTDFETATYHFDDIVGAAQIYADARGLIAGAGSDVVVTER